MMTGSSESPFLCNRSDWPEESSVTVVLLVLVKAFLHRSAIYGESSDKVFSFSSVSLLSPLQSFSLFLSSSLLTFGQRKKWWSGAPPSLLQSLFLHRKVSLQNPSSSWHPRHCLHAPSFLNTAFFSGSISLLNLPQKKILLLCPLSPQTPHTSSSSSFFVVFVESIFLSYFLSEQSYFSIVSTVLSCLSLSIISSSKTCQSGCLM